MHVTVKFLSENIVIAVPGTATVEWLKNKAVHRYAELFEKLDQAIADTASAQDKSRDKIPVTSNELIVVRRRRDFAILHPLDIVSDVLTDGEYVLIESAKSPPHHLNEQDRLYIAEEPGFQQSLGGKKYLQVDGNSLTPKLLMELGLGHYRIALTEEAIENVNAARKVINDIETSKKVTYGVNTGFGLFKSTVIDSSKLKELQFSLIRSHAAGVGEPLDLQTIRMLFALRINVLAKGYSGVSLDTLQKMINIYNASCIPWVPARGTVGASGDLAPLAHLAMGLIGEGNMWSPQTGWTTAGNVLVANRLEPLDLKAKEGLCLINGTQLITSIGCRACVRAEQLALQADVIAALTLDVWMGTTLAFDEDVCKVRPHKGQTEVARRMRSVLNNEVFASMLAESHKYCCTVQDPYTLRCCPQIHGIVWDTIVFVKDLLTTEMNSATDNPLVFPERDVVLSAGNFHGEYPAKALDYLAIAVHELANVSERRIERLVNPSYSKLPAFLTKRGGLNSGFMMAHVTAAALVSENKVLCHPSSIDSLTTSAGQEDHVSMGGFSARKCLQVVDNVEYVLAIELLAAAQAVEFRRPIQSTEPLEAVYRLVRSVSAPWEEDRYIAPDVEAIRTLIREGKVWEAVRPCVDEYNAFMERKKEKVSSGCR